MGVMKFNWCNAGVMVKIIFFIKDNQKMPQIRKLDQGMNINIYFCQIYLTGGRQLNIFFKLLHYTTF